MFNSSGLVNRFVSSVQFWKKIHSITKMKDVRKNFAGKRVIYVKLPDLEIARRDFKLYVSDPNWNFPDIPETESEGEDL